MQPPENSLLHFCYSTFWRLH